MIPGQQNLALWMYFEGDPGDPLPHFHTVDFVRSLRIRLHDKILAREKGYHTRVGYYGYDDQNNPAAEVLVVTIDSVHDHNASHDAIGRTEIVTWYNIDGTAHPDTKTRSRAWDDPFDQLAKSEDRRGRVVKYLKVDVLVALIATGVAASKTEAEAIAGPYLLSKSADLASYEKNGLNHAALAADAMASSESWMDTDLAPLGYPSGYKLRNLLADSLTPPTGKIPATT